MKAGFFILSLIFLLCQPGTADAQEKKKVPIPGLFNTGVDNSRMPLADGEADPHYILALSADGSFPGPDARVVFSEGFPMDCWMKNDSRSKWIAPRADAGEFNSQGIYVYTLSFSLSGFKPETAEIRGLWATDNNGTDIMINGKSTGYTTDYISFAAGFYPFEIIQGFTGGINTISFAVYNGEAPTGLRVVIYGEAEQIEYVNK
jgi:hypothetical protein